MTTTSQSARDRILEAAERQVHERGFNATTLDAILEEANASKGAFFHHFASKEALGRALIDQYAERDAALLDEAMKAAETTSDDAGEQVLAFLEYFEEQAADIPALPPGCLFVSFVYERGPGMPPDDDVVVDAIESWRRRLLTKLEKAAPDHPRLAEVDLELRGEGTLMSTSQKGRSDLKLASLRRDRELVELARGAAFELVDADPGLANHPLLADELELLFTEEASEFLTKS